MCHEIIKGKNSTKRAKSIGQIIVDTFFLLCDGMQAQHSNPQGRSQEYKHHFPKDYFNILKQEGIHILLMVYLYSLLFIIEK